MLEQQNTLTYEGVLEMFRQTDRQFQETDRKIQEVAEQLKRTQKEIGKLGGRIGDIVVSMVKGDIVDKFQDLGFNVQECTPRKPFRNKELGFRGEIDLFLDKGDVDILIEVKTTLETADVRRHIERLEKYRRYVDAKGGNDKRRFIGAVAGSVVSDEVANFAQQCGFYVIVQSGRAVEIVTPPKEFSAKEW